VIEKNAANSLTSLIAEKIENDKQLISFLSYGTNAKANLHYTFNALNELFKTNIKY
jgi:hypothetical protein